jgi:hypothetical protein
MTDWPVVTGSGQRPQGRRVYREAQILVSTAGTLPAAGQEADSGEHTGRTVASRNFSEEKWAVLASYEGAVVYRNPQGRVPGNLATTTTSNPRL